jgi:hypothetical protein
MIILVSTPFFSCLAGQPFTAVKIPQEFGSRPLDKLRYLLAFMKEQKSFVHWFGRLAFLS